MTDSIVDQVTDPSKTKLFLSDASANIMKQLELTKYVKDSSTFADRVGALEDMLRSFFQTQEDYSKYLEIQLTVQRERCVELTDKWNNAENQSRTHKIYLNETRKNLEETKKSLNEARENLNEVNRTNPKKEMIELRGDKKEVIELRQKILQHKATEERYAQQILELKRLLEHSQREHENYKVRTNHEFQEMQQKHKGAEARAAELQKKYDLLKEEAIKYSIKELSAGPCRSNPLTELEMEKAELHEQLREARVNANSYHNAYQHEKAERAAERGRLEESFRREFQQMTQRIKDNEAREAELQRRNNLLKEQAASYEAALGDITHVSWGDNGKNYTVQLGKDIVKLQNSLEEFTRLKGRQRFIIEVVLKYTQSYFNICIADLNKKSDNEIEQYPGTNINYFLEELILNTTSNLERYINQFVGYILKEFDESKKKDIEDLATSIVLEIIHLFYFRFQTQVPVVEYQFFENGTKFDSATMECVQDDHNKEQVVEICSFPLVGVNISDEQKKQIFHKAKVQLRPGFSG
ncbi:1713_t:CDS:2 [Paraglomus occultum]|uniref:1713_t:CDS:1 n=1 Tax=Paraglomus occultum TaxID=144539 RepID=A0A9N9B3D8_9GLOM|nr:1713_t:CDS:2 [Paraglomus occultum]